MSASRIIRWRILFTCLGGRVGVGEQREELQAEPQVEEPQ